MKRQGLSIDHELARRKLGGVWVGYVRHSHWREHPELDWPCWVVPGRARYPVVRLRGKGPVKQTRLAVAALTDVDLKGLQVLHRCDNGRCWNPLHLAAGTNRQNRADALWKRLKVKPEVMREALKARRAGMRRYEVMRRYGLSEMVVQGMLPPRMRGERHWSEEARL